MQLLATLPSEVIAEVIELGITLIPLGVDEWGLSVTDREHLSHVVTGPIEEIVAAFGAWMAKKAELWRSLEDE